MVERKHNLDESVSAERCPKHLITMNLIHTDNKRDEGLYQTSYTLSGKKILSCGTLKHTSHSCHTWDDEHDKDKYFGIVYSDDNLLMIKDQQ